MKEQYLTVDEFVKVITQTLKNMLDRDFGPGEMHIVDLMTHATTGMEWIYQFVDAKSGLDYERRLKVKVEDIEPIIKSEKKKGK